MGTNDPDIVTQPSSTGICRHHTELATLSLNMEGQITVTRLYAIVCAGEIPDGQVENCGLKESLLYGTLLSKSQLLTIF